MEKQGKFEVGKSHADDGSGVAWIKPKESRDLVVTNQETLEQESLSPEELLNKKSEPSLDTDFNVTKIIEV